MSFRSHTHYTVSRANHILGLIISKCFQYLDNNMLLSLYKTIVHPIVEYGNDIWGPHFALDQQSLSGGFRGLGGYSPPPDNLKNTKIQCIDKKCTKTY